MVEVREVVVLVDLVVREVTLGVAGLVYARHSWIPVPGEGGHVDLGPRTARDLEIFPHIERIEGRVSAEQILCGRGLLGLYQAICTADGMTATLATPADVSNKGLSGEDKQAAEAVHLFAIYLGRVAGDMAVSTWLLTGTARTGESIRVRGVDLLHFRDGKIVKKDSYWKIVER